MILKSKFNEELKKKAFLMYLNNESEKQLGCSRTAITNWVKKSKEKLYEELKKFEPNYSQKNDIIELDEIYTYVQKKQSYGMLTLGFKNVLLHIT